MVIGRRNAALAKQRAADEAAAPAPAPAPVAKQTAKKKTTWMKKTKKDQ